MKRKSFLLSLMACLCLPLTMQAQGISEKAMQQLRESNNTICYVNTKAPGVHKEYDSKYGGEVWKTGMGSILCTDKNMRPLEDMDKNVYYTGVNNNPDNPEVGKFNLNNVQKVWDKDRGCYVWKDKFGNFLGRDKPSIDKQKEWANKKDKNWMDKGSIPKKKLNPEAEKAQKEIQKLTKELEKEAGSGSYGVGDNEDYDEGDGDDDDYGQGGASDWSNLDGLSHEEIMNLMITSDEQLRQAEAALNQARAAIAAAAAQGVNVGDYADLSALNYVEKAINEYKRARNKMK